MPNTRHRKKTLRKANEANTANRAQRAAMGTAVKRARKAITEGADNVDAAVNQAFKKIDKAAKTRLIHPNKAARAKSKLAQARNAGK